MKSKKKIIFILCAMRSGSTLLKNMLDQHPEIFAPAELHILPFDSLDDMELNFKGTTLATGLVEAIQKLKSCDEIQASLIYEMFKQNNFSSRDIYDWFLSNMEETFLVDKSPTYTMRKDVLKRIEDLNTTAYYIHLTRHPVAGIESIVRNKFEKLARMIHCNGLRSINKYRKEKKQYTSDFIFFEHSYLKDARNPVAAAEGCWTAANQNILSVLKDIPASRKLTLTYEILVDAPEKTMAQLCHFLGIVPNPAMCNPFQKNMACKETIGDPNFFKHNSITNQNSFSLYNTLGEDIRVNKQTVDLALKFNYLCWEAEQAIPLLPAEQKFFTQNNYPDNHCLITTFEAFQLTNFRARKLVRALKELMIENPTLSSVFAKNNEQWERQLIHLPAIKICRLFCKPGQDKEAVLEAYTKEWINKLDIQSGPLFTIFYIYNNKNFTVRYIAHHLLMDGMAMAKFHEQLWNKTLSSTPDHLAFSAKNGVGEYLENVSSIANPEEEFNSSELIPCFKNIGFSANYDSQEEFTVNVSKQHVHKNRFSYDEIACALYLTLQHYSGLPEIAIAHRFHHRNDFGKNWKNMIAWLADDLPILLNCNQEKITLLQQFNQRRKIASKESNKITAPSKGNLLHKYCQVRLNYIPILKRNNLAGNTFNAPVSTLSFDKKNTRDYVLDFIVREHSNHLELIIRYSDTQLNAHFIQNLVRKWKSNFDAFYAVEDTQKIGVQQ